MAAIAVPLITAGISALAGLFGGRKKEATQDTTTTQNYNSSSTNSANFSPLQQKLMNMFSQGAMDNYNSAANMDPYKSQGLQTIAGQGNANRQTISNLLAQRGLSYSPAAGAPLVQNLMNTGNQQSQFSSQIPLLQRQQQQQGLEQLFKAFGIMPTSSTTTGTGQSTSVQHGVGVQNGNPLAGFLGGLGSGIAAGFPQYFDGSSGGSSGKTQTGYYDGSGKWINS